MADFFPLQLLLATFAGWVNREQAQLIAYLIEENRVLKERDRANKLLPAGQGEQAASGPRSEALGESLIVSDALVTTDCARAVEARCLDFVGARTPGARGGRKQRDARGRASGERQALFRRRSGLGDDGGVGALYGGGRKIKDAVKAKQLPKDRPEKLLVQAQEAGLITAGDVELVREAEVARADALAVDSFTLQEYLEMGRVAEEAPAHATEAMSAS